MHELTQKILQHYEDRKCLGYTITDELVRSYLQQKAEEIHRQEWCGDNIEELLKIFGLEGGKDASIPIERVLKLPESPQEYAERMHANIHQPEPKEAGEDPYGKPWVCEKCGSTWDCWQYCAKCGAPRPENTLESEMAEYLWKENNSNSSFYGDDINNFQAKKIAKYALAFLKEKGLMK